MKPENGYKYIIFYSYSTIILVKIFSLVMQINLTKRYFCFFLCRKHKILVEYRYKCPPFNPCSCKHLLLVGVLSEAFASLHIKRMLEYKAAKSG